MPFCFGFGFGQAAPGNFGIGVDNRGNDDVFKSARLAEDCFDGDLGFFGCAVRQ